MPETVRVNESPFSASEGMVTGMVTVPLEVVEPERLVAINPCLLYTSSFFKQAPIS